MPVETSNQTVTADQIAGCLLGTAIGDALGLPYEGLSRQRAEKLLGVPDRYRLFFRRGMLSDDTDHTCLVALSLLEAGGDPELFQRRLARHLKIWLLTLPPGIGLATGKSIAKLLLGFSPQRSGVFSAGNGPAMRSAILGVLSPSLDQMRDSVRLSTWITHTDPKAEYGAWGIALAAFLAARQREVTPASYLEKLRETLPEEAAEFLELITRMVASVEAGQSPAEFAVRMGWGRKVTGYVYQSVPVALHGWLSHLGEFLPALQSVIRCGGDADTIAAMTGGILGGSLGAKALPEPFLRGIWEPVFTQTRLHRLSEQLARLSENSTLLKRIRFPVGLRLGKNLLMLPIVLGHGFRRLFPPW